MVLSGETSLLHRPGVHQFVKFCIVGASSFVIDYCIARELTFAFHLWWVLARTISFSVAVTNGFFWNLRWTFKAAGDREQHKQYTMFVLVNIVGWFLNLAIMKTVFFISTGHWRGQHPKSLTWNIAFLMATGIVLFWNYFANKLWTFRPPQKDPS